MKNLFWLILLLPFVNCSSTKNSNSSSIKDNKYIRVERTSYNKGDKISVQYGRESVKPLEKSIYVVTLTDSIFRYDKNLMDTKTIAPSHTTIAFAPKSTHSYSNPNQVNPKPPCYFFELVGNKSFVINDISEIIYKYVVKRNKDCDYSFEVTSTEFVSNKYGRLAVHNRYGGRDVWSLLTYIGVDKSEQKHVEKLINQLKNDEYFMGMK